jgi:hypothetical protein
MKLNRRGFFGFSAATPFAAKDIAKKIIEEGVAMEAASVSTYTDSLYTGISTSSVGGPMRNLWEAIRDMGVPDWKKEDLRADARRSRTLDPDIAAMRSFSLSAKMRMQWERNYLTLVDRALQQTRIERMKRSFFESNPDVSEY